VPILPCQTGLSLTSLALNPSRSTDLSIEVKHECIWNIQPGWRPVDDIRFPLDTAAGVQAYIELGTKESSFLATDGPLCCQHGHKKG
jgi:hypothetical protein